MLRANASFLALFLLSSACGRSDPAATSAPIVDGVRETGEPAIVYVQGVVGTCTGTLISDRVVLTAKHCVQLAGADGPLPPSFFVVGIGDRMGAVMQQRVQSVLTTPGAWRGNAITDGSDIALFILREPVTGVTPIPVRRETATELVGQTVTAIGFGTTPAGEIGIKYRTTATIETVTSAVLIGRNAICQGDSGGPIILEGADRRVVGVASYGQLASTTATCPALADAWNRVDTQMALIDRAILRSGGCLGAAEETCNSIDDDCDGTTDEGCAALGEACSADTDCAFAALPEGVGEGDELSAVCVSGACTLPCDARTPALGCTSIPHPFGGAATPLSGFYCARTAGCEGLCMRGEAGTLGNAAACTADTDCASLLCAEIGAERRCATPCEGAALSCPSDEACSSSSAGTCGLCVGASSVPSGRTLGEPCELADQCASGACGVVDGVSICTTACTADGACSPRMRCEAGFCARGARSGAGGPCLDDGDCVAGVSCVTRGDVSFCGLACTADRECSGGTCEDVGGAMVCVPPAPVVGAACTDACATGTCVGGVCRALCGGAETCPSGYACSRESGVALCAPRSSGGGCSASHGRASGLSLGLLALAALVSARRRRARTPDRRRDGSASSQPARPCPR